MRTAYRTLTLILLVAALVGCGDSSNDANLLSRSSAADLRATLSQVQQKVESGDCNGAQDQVSLLEQQIDSLDTSVDSDLRSALVSSATRLQRLVAASCAAATGETGATGPTGPADTGGTTGLDEPDELTKEEKKALKEQEKARKEQEKEQKKQEQQDSTGGSGDGAGGGSGTTGSGGSVP
jgi:hypothetical protein